MRSQDWFGRRTSTSKAWCRRRLADLKGDTTVSLVLPARDEAPTVGAIVSALRRELMARVPLLDELVVVDSGSCDATARVAERSGARVVRQEEVLQRLGDEPGKGEALWKSLIVTRGDIVGFIDADLRNFDPQFAVALVGPLLSDHTVDFVKGFYDRPLNNGAPLWDRARLSAETIGLLRARGDDIRKHLITDVVDLEQAPSYLMDVAARRRYVLSAVFTVDAVGLGAE